jgi:hypothetical protein
MERKRATGMDQQHDRAEFAPVLHVVEIDPQTDPRWETMVVSSEDGLIYHHPAWLKVLEEAYAYKATHLACEDLAGQIRGILPLFYTCGLLSGRRVSSLPRTPVAGPLACDDQAMSFLVRAAVERVRDTPGIQLQFKMPADGLDRLVENVVGIPWKAAYRLSLPIWPELPRLDSRVKRAINKAARLSVDIHPAETERELRAWYELYLITMRHLVVLPRPYHFFKTVWEQLQPRGLARLLLARHYEAGRGRLLAGSLFLMSGRTVFYAFTGWKREDQAFRPNDAIHWQAIQKACEEGFRYYDFGEVDGNDTGLSAFKSKWGAEEKWLYRYYYPEFRESEITTLESVRQFSGTMWQRLPLKVTSILGDLVHHYL